MSLTALTTAMNVSYLNLVTNAADPFGKISKSISWLSNGIKSISGAICILGIVVCGAMFMMSDSLGEKAKHRLLMIGGGMILVGCAGLIADGLKGVAY